jgi:glucuronate isomerase
VALHPDRLFPADPTTRAIARRLFAAVETLPLISPHGHTEPRWFAENAPFPDPAQLLIVPDHYVTRMLVSRGVSLADLGVPRRDGGPVETDGRTIWRRFASHYHLFRGTPTRMWLDAQLGTLFSITEPLTANLGWHKQIRASGWTGRIIPTYRPDAVVDPDRATFRSDLDRLGELTGCDTGSWQGYLDAHRERRAFFKSMGATASDHGHPSARTADLAPAEAAALYAKIRAGKSDAADHESFRAQMLTEMAAMSMDDGLVLQIHPGSWRNHSPQMFASFGPDRGFDIPQQTDYVGALKPLLDRFGMESKLTIIVFTLDEATYSRELAPLAGAYPALRLGPPWWFFDSPEGMLRFREAATETAGFYNTVGFNDDTRAFPSIPARHDVARRVDCAHLARLVAEHRLHEDEAFELARALAYDLPKAAYRL